MIPRTVPVAKRAHKKSRNGCQQCKLRKVKCDERHPLCARCEIHFEGLDECDFPPHHEGAGKPRKKYPSPMNAPPTQTRRRKSIQEPRDPRIPTLLGAGIDPFMVHPDSNVPDAQLLMHHYFSNFTTKTFPIVLSHETKPLVARWWDWAGHDAVLFHATIHLSAIHLAGLRGEVNDTHSKFLLNKECIRLLRERIDDPVLSTSNETIGSIIFLIIIEFERGNQKMVRMHVAGLKRMVKLRGGLNAIGGTLANMVFGITWTVMTEPQFPPEMEDDHAPERWGEIAQHHFHDNTLEEFGVTTSYARMIREVSYMTYLLVTGEIKPATNYCADVLSRLMYLEPPPERTSMYISEATRIAAGIACMIPFRQDYPNPRLMFNVQLHKLKVMIERVIDINPGNGMLPWLLGVGGITSMEPEKSWFVSELVEVADALDIRTYEDYKPHQCSQK